MRNRLVAALALGLLACLPAAGARGDIVELDNGSTFEGEVTKTTRSVQVKTSSGATFTFENEQVRDVRPGSWREEYARRRDRLKPTDAAGHYRLALWCAARKLDAEQEGEIAAALAADPKFEPARERRATIESERQNPLEKLSEALPAEPGEPARHRTAHITVTADGGPEVARRVAEIAEGTLRDFARVYGVPEDSRALEKFRVTIRYYARRSDFDEACRQHKTTSGNGFYTSLGNECHLLAERSDGRIGIITFQSVRHEVTHALTLRVLGVWGRPQWLAETTATAMEGEGADGLGGGMEWTRMLFFTGRMGEPTSISVDDLLAAGSKGAVSLQDYARCWSFAHFMLYGEELAKNAVGTDGAPAADRAERIEAAKKRRAEFLSMLGEIGKGGWEADANAIFKRHFPDAAALEADWAAHMKALKDYRARKMYSQQQLRLRAEP